jgi:hypothetical protein
VEESPEEMHLPLIRFEYAFDAEVLDPDLRAELAGQAKPGTRRVAVMPFMAEIGSRVERALADVPGLQCGIGLSELRLREARDWHEPTPASELPPH